MSSKPTKNLQISSNSNDDSLKPKKESLIAVRSLKFDYENKIKHPKFEVFKGTFGFTETNLSERVSIVKAETATKASEALAKCLQVQSIYIHQLIDIVPTHSNLFEVFEDVDETLETFLNTNCFNVRSAMVRTMIKEILLGLNAIQDENVVHGKLHQSNVFVKTQKGKTICKIGFLDGSKMVPEKTFMEESFADVRALGELILFILTSGNYKQHSDQQTTLLKLAKDKYLLELSLVLTCLRASIKQPVKAAYLLNHPAVWTPKKKLRFYTNVSNACHHKPEANYLEINQSAIVGGDWFKHIPSGLRDYIRKTPQLKYLDGRCVKDLIRLIRNLMGHRKEFEKEVRELRLSEQGIVDLFDKAFPALLFSTFCSMQQIKTNKALEEFYELNFNFNYNSTRI